MLFTTLLFIQIMFNGCQTTRYYSTPKDSVYLLADYEDTLQQWTMADEIHKRLISIADGRAVYQSWEVREGYISVIRDRMNPSPEYLQSVIDRNIEQFENGNEFYIGLYCHEKDWCKMTGIDPVWYLTLTNDSGITLRPQLIEEYAIRSEQAWMFLNEMTTHGRKVFRVIFPKYDSNGDLFIDKTTTTFTLQCHSLLGTLAFRWDLNPIPGGLD